MWEDRLLFTGASRDEAFQKAKETLAEIEKKLSEWKGRKIQLCNIEEMKPTNIGGTIYYYNIIKPLAIWNGVGKCDFSKLKFDKNEKYKKEWKKETSDLDNFGNDNDIIRREV